jgi:hypothetical protein
VLSLTLGPAVRTFTGTVTALTSDRKWKWTFHKGDRVTNLRRIGSRARFDAGDNVPTIGTFEMGWIPFLLATEEKLEPLQGSDGSGLF